jgi:precorrin-2 dehydrogenase / sirohydrochlorin ferrochelatase
LAVFNEPTAGFLPVQLRLTGQLVVVIGGGPVGQRKARAALEVGAQVRLIALESKPENFQFPGLEWLQTPYEKSHLIGAVLVFAAASETLNFQVVCDALAMNIWVNDAADPDRGNIVLPAVGRVGRITVAVSTSGAAPAAAAYLRDHFLEQIDETTALWIELLAEIRARILVEIRSETQRHHLIRQVSHRRWIEQIALVGEQAIRSQWQQMLDEVRSS